MLDQLRTVLFARRTPTRRDARIALFGGMLLGALVLAHLGVITFVLWQRLDG